MTDAPERIWAWARSQRSFLAYEDKPEPPANPTEYIRKDIADAAVLAEQQKLTAMAQKFDELHPDPALMAKIIMTSIERDVENADLKAKLDAIRARTPQEGE